jgi:threonine/homoserine/homoserine lactone efflux protein
MDERLVVYLLVAAVLIVTPGPDTALVVRNALNSGARAATATAFGIGLGSVAWAAASVLGVALLVETSAAAFTVFKLAGAAYLGYLGIRSLLGRRPAPSALTVRGSTLSDTGAFRQGLLGNLLNPKAAAIFVTVFPQFVGPGDSPLRLALMLAAYEAMLLPWLTMYGHLVARAGRSRLGERFREALERVTGVVLLGLGVRLALERR